MSLKNFDDFLNNKLLLEAIREFKFILSGRLKKVLQNINSEISDALLELHDDDNSRTKKTFVDINETKDEYLTIIQSNKVGEILDIDNENYLELYPEWINRYKNLHINHDVYNRYRSDVRIGRFINSLFPGKFPVALPTNVTEKSKDVENFVRMYKSSVSQDERFRLLDLVSGGNISYYYDCDNYENSQGSMGSSCMSEVNSDYFEIYDNNPNTIELLVLYSSKFKNRIEARALIWTLYEPSDRKLMDRIYTNNSSDEQIFIDYAKRNGWLFRATQGWSGGNIVDPLTNTARNMNLMVNVSAEDYEYYPWMDTMYYYSPERGILSNQPNNLRLYIQYESGRSTTNNSYDPDLDREVEYVHSKYHNEDIDKSDAKYCYYGDDWIKTADAKRVFNAGLSGTTNPNSDGKVYTIPGHPKVVRSVLPGLTYDKHFPKKKCVWSDYLNTWIFKWKKVRVYLDKDRKKFGIDHIKRLNINFAKVGRVHYVIQLVKKDENDKWKLIDENEKV